MDIQSKMFCNEDVVKHESEGSICNLCLSSDRTLSLLRDNTDLFISLLGQQGQFVATDSVYVCWECKAVLRRIRKFQYQVQHAQSVFQTQFVKYLTPLSNLSKVKLVNFDTTTDLLESESLEKANTDILSFNSPTVLCSEKEKCHVIDAKEIMPIILKQEDLEYESNENFDYADDTEQTSYEIKSEKQMDKTEKACFRKVLKYAKVTKNRQFDAENLDSCFYQYVLTESDILNSGKKIKSKELCRSNQLYSTCKDCELAFDSGLDMRRHKTYCHVLKKQSQKRWKCLECDARCADRTQLAAHWTEHNTVMRCKLCPVVLPAAFISRMRTHAKSHQHSFTCKLCPDWHRTYRMRTHAKSHQHSFTCKLCPDWHRTYRSFKEFSGHYRTIHKYSICDYCGKRASSKNAVLKHIRLKHLPPVCGVCNKSFKDHRAAARHKYTVHPEDKRTNPELTYCVECNKHFLNAAKYKLHLAKTVAHNPKLAEKKTIVPCPECDKLFTRKLYMNNHYRLYHQKRTKHYCAICDKYLVTAWAMKVHIRGVHEKIRDPKTKVCDLCGRAFGTNAILEKHRRTHTGERPYKCKLCAAAFTQSSPLASHMKTQHRTL